MTETARSVLVGWENFYVIVGSSGGALIGLQFVVVALVAEKPRAGADVSISAFGTPVVVHLGAALVISAFMSAPWPSLFAISHVLIACGLLGILYSTYVVYIAHRQKKYYHPVWQDWLWHVSVPASMYVLLIVSGALLGRSTGSALFGIAAAALTLLINSIHNAWDTVKFIVADRARSGHGSSPASSAEIPHV
jgi:hypothetical protein